MRTYLSVSVGAVLVILLVGIPRGIGQPQGQGKGPKAPDEAKEILDQIKEAYKAPYEVHEDVLKELRKLYQQPSSEREAKIFKELRRLYQLTADQETTILQEIRRAYEQPSAEREERVFQEIHKANRLPLGAVPPSEQVEKTRKMFVKLDLNGDGVLSPEEMTEPLHNERGRWDADRGGSIDPDEYWAYYQGRLRDLSERVATGQIELNVKRAEPAGGPIPTDGQEQRTTVYRAGKLPPGLPDWFSKLDADGDAQIGLYEWKGSGRPLQEFFGMDRNGDGFVTVEEVARHLAQQPADRAGTRGSTPRDQGGRP